MAYVTKEFYNDTFHGTPVPDDDFPRLAETASDVIDSLVYRPITDQTDKTALAKATAYEIEYIWKQGGIEAVTGNAESSKVLSESLDDYSVNESKTSSAQQAEVSLGNIPVSPLTLSILRTLGLMCRWAYAETAERRRRELFGK